jgi:hypothetical protein
VDGIWEVVLVLVWVAVVVGVGVRIIRELEKDGKGREEKGEVLIN